MDFSQWLRFMKNHPNVFLLKKAPVRMYDQDSLGELYDLLGLTICLCILDSMFPARKVKQCTSHEIGV